MTLADQAAALGLPVFPCCASKRPAIGQSQGGRGHLDATDDPVEINRLFASASAEMIGMPTGERTGIDVLDLDYRDGAREWEQANAHRLPETRTHKTQSGGRHLLFRHAPGVRNSASRVGPGVDVRGDGGYAIVPPSPGYEVISDAEIADWPDWLLAEVLPKTRPETLPVPATPRAPLPQERIDRIVTRALDKVRSAADGQKHYTLRNMALLLGGLQHQAGFSDSEALGWLMAALPSTAKDRRHAETTARWGLDAGRRSPLDLESHLDRSNLFHLVSEPPPSCFDDPGYIAALENAMSATEWAEIEQRESGAPIPASPEARKQDRGPLIWTIDEAWTEADLQPRPWVAKGYLLRGAVTVLSGPGSAGKSSMMVAWTCALSLGCAFGKFKPSGPLRVGTYNVEDDQQEQKRRFSAMARLLGVDIAQIIGNARIIGPNGVGTLLHMREDGRLLINTPVMDDLEAWVCDYRPDVLILDPFVELHSEEENDNTAVRAVMARFRSMAVAHDMSVVILHHSRKGPAAPGDPDSMRGAGAIVGAARCGLTLNVMSQEEAEQAGVPAAKRRNFFRLDDAKQNYAPIEDAEWFERKVISFDNGEDVVAAWPWKPTTVWTEMTPRIANAILDRIGAGLNGTPYSPVNKHNNGRWGGTVVIDEIGCTPEQAATVITTWLRNGVLEETQYRDPAQRKMRAGLVVNNDKRPS